MWLKNKTTGQIIEIDTDKWEQCEMKDYWFVDSDGEVEYEPSGSSLDQGRKELGNYFETKEEAEKAAERLRAWKRLKDKGFKFNRWQFLDDKKGVWVDGNTVPNIVDDLNILFGGSDDN